MKLASSPVEEFLDHHPAAGGAERVAGQHVAHRGFGLGVAPGEDHALAGCQAVGFDDNRSAVIMDECQGLIEVGEDAVAGGRDTVSGQEVFGEGLRALQLRRLTGGSEDGQPGVQKGVDDARDQWRFGAHDRQVDGRLLGEIQQTGNVFGTDVDVAQTGLARGSGIAGCHEYGFNCGRLCRPPRQGVLAAASAYHQYLHDHS